MDCLLQNIAVRNKYEMTSSMQFTESAVNAKRENYQQVMCRIVYHSCCTMIGTHEQFMIVGFISLDFGLRLDFFVNIGSRVYVYWCNNS